MPRPRKEEKAGVAVLDPKPKRGRPAKVKTIETAVPEVKKNRKRRTSPTDGIDREQARMAELPIAQFRVLKVLSDEPVDYAFIQEKTGYYNNLTKILRRAFEGSLCDLKLAKETLSDDTKRTRSLFTITPTGKKLLSKVQSRYSKVKADK